MSAATCVLKRQVSTSYRAQWKFLGGLPYCLANPDFLQKWNFLSSLSSSSSQFPASRWWWWLWWWKGGWAMCWFSIPLPPGLANKVNQWENNCQRWQENIIVIEIVILILIIIIIIILIIKIIIIIIIMKFDFSSFPQWMQRLLPHSFWFSFSAGRLPELGDW